MITASPAAESLQQPRPDLELLSAFVDTRDQRAFAELVRRYGGLVFHAALRRTGDAGLSEEVTQSAFALLARKSVSLSTHPSLASWLQRTAFWLAGDVVARESAHRRRVKSYAENAALHAAGEDPLASALPHLDAALQSLRESDRRLILLRFHENLSFQAMGERLRQPHDTARKATQRAVERLGIALRRSGVVLPGVALTSILSAALTAPAPAALLSALPSSMIAASGSMGGKALLLNSLHAMTAAKQTAAAAALVALIAVPMLGIQHWADTRQAPAADGVPLMTPAPGGEKMSGDGPGAVSAARPQVTDVAAMLRGVDAAEDPCRAAAVAAMEITRMDPAQLPACLAAAREIKNTELGKGLTLGLYLRWARTDPSAAMHSALSDGEDGNSGAVAGVMAVWMRRDPDKATAWLEQADGTAKQWVLLHAHEAISRIAPEKLSDICNSLPDGQQHFVAWNFPLRQLELSKAILPGLTSAAVRKDFVNALTAGDRSGKPEALLRWGMENLQGGELRALISGSLKKWAGKDPAAAFAWYQAQPDGSVPRQGLEGFSQLPETDYQDFRRRLPEEERREWDFQRAAKLPGAEAAACLSSLPEGKRRADLFESTAQKWAENEPGAATAWVDSLPEGTLRDQAAEGLSEGLKTMNPEAALIRAGTIGDDAMRGRVMVTRWREWLSSDAAGAWRWLRKSGIDPEMRAVIQALNESPLK